MPARSPALRRSQTVSLNRADAGRAIHTVLSFLQDGFWTFGCYGAFHILGGGVDSSLFTHQPVSFDVGLGWPGMVKILLAIAVAAVLLLASLEWLVVRRIWQRRVRQVALTAVESQA